MEVDPEVQRRQVVGRIAGLLFAAGAVASAPANVLFHDPEPPSYVHLINLLALVSGIGCALVPWGRLSGRWLNAIGVVATAEVALTVWSVGPHGDVYAWYYVLIAVFMGYAYHDRRVIAAQSSLALVAFWLPALGDRAGDGDATVRALVGGPMLLITAWIVMFLREGLQKEQASLRELAERTRQESLTDALTGLGNRRRLLADLDDALAAGPRSPASTLALFDLNGFKGYNDAFGHPAGDSLLRRLGQALDEAVRGRGVAYRLGGDEFCVLLHEDEWSATPALIARAARALADRGDGFNITSSYGSASLPGDAIDAAAALGLADQRMYGHKTGQRMSAATQSSEVLLRLLAERQPELGNHLREVATLARDVARRLGLGAERVDEIVRAAELHDVGKSAIPDAILDKPGPLDADEWAFIHRHTIIGERILLAAPALAPVARLVRSSHERFDGAGYPDALAGDEVPLGARIVAVCDAYHAITTPERPYREPRSHEEAMAELRRCSGGQFDPAVVDAFCAVIDDHRSTEQEPAPATGSQPGAHAA